MSIVNATPKPLPNRMPGEIEIIDGRRNGLEEYRKIREVRQKIRNNCIPYDSGDPKRKYNYTNMYPSENDAYRERPKETSEPTRAKSSRIRRIGSTAVSFFKREGKLEDANEQQPKTHKIVKGVAKAACIGVGLFVSYQLGAKYGADTTSNSVESNFSWLRSVADSYTQQVSVVQEAMGSDEFLRMTEAPEAFDRMVEWVNDNPDKSLSEVYGSDEFGSMVQWINANPDKDIGEVFASENFQNLVNNRQ